jgi:predicted DNA-binding antitoxin AbrB/MazE fold protein
MLKELHIFFESYLVTNLSILVEWIYNNDVFEVINPINMNDGNPIEIVNIEDDTVIFQKRSRLHYQRKLEYHKKMNKNQPT